MSEELPLSQRTWFVVLLLFLFWPVGLFLLWRCKVVPKWVKVSVSAFFVLVISVSFLLSSEQSSTSSEKVTGSNAPVVSQSEETKETTLVKETKVKKVDPKSKIKASAVSPMTQKDYPKTYKAWGAKQIERINGLMPKVALRVAESDSCDIVTWVSLSDNRSTPKQEAVFLVQCQNDERFYISEKNLDEPAESVQKRTAKFSDDDYENACYQHMLKGLAPTVPSLSLGVRTYRATATGNVVVRQPFTLEDNYGRDRKFTAICTFDDRGLVDIDVKDGYQ